MSRSRRKNPYQTDGQDQPGTRKKIRRKANKRIRASEDVSDFGAFKKFFNSWDISDWSFYDPKKGYRK